MLKRFLSTSIGEIRILSRDEKNKTISARRHNDKLQFYLGDVREYSIVLRATLIATGTPSSVNLASTTPIYWR